MTQAVTSEKASWPPSKNGRVSVPPWVLLLLAGGVGTAGGGGLSKMLTPELPADLVHTKQLDEKLKDVSDNMKLETTKLAAQLDAIQRELAVVKGNVSNLEGKVTEVKTIVEERVPRRR